jgi:hypothetical protein
LEQAFEGCPRDAFLIPAMTREEILTRFFFRGNFVPSITTFARRDIFDAAGPMNPLLFGLHDFDHHIKLIKRTAFAFVPQPLVSWRIRNNNMNSSVPTASKMIRHHNELALALRGFFDDMPPDLFLAAFKDYFRNPDARSTDELTCEMAFLYLRPEMPGVAHSIGLDKLFALLQEPKFSRILSERFAFGTQQFVELMGQRDTAKRF